MNIIDVIPLISLPRQVPAIASYFYKEKLEIGTVVQVLFNNRKVKAVVIDSHDIKNVKIALKKQATFTLKPILKVLKDPKVTSSKLQVARDLAEYYIAPLGICMRAVYLHPEEKNYRKYIYRKPSVDLPDLEMLQVSSYKLQVVDMRREIRDANYSIFSRDLKDALQTYDKIIIFIPRKGYANSLLCKACGNTIKCPNCSVSLVLSGSTAQLECHHCKHKEAMPKTCPKCYDYNLKPYGIGMDKVEAELEKFFKYQNLAKPKIAKLTSETKKMPEDWNILLATQSIFKYSLHVPYLAVMNADTLINIPDYSAEEKLLRQTLALASMAERTLVQTYNSEDPALIAASTGKIKEFWDAELEMRKKLGYPPFTKLILLTYRHRFASAAADIAEAMAKKLNGIPYPALIARERGLYVWHVLLKIPLDVTSYTLQATRQALRALPPDWQIDIDPESIV